MKPDSIAAADGHSFAGSDGAGSDDKTAEKATRMQDRIDTEFETFDSKPNAAGAGVDVGAAFLGCSISSVWERARRSQIPKPQKAALRALWNVGELHELLPGAC